MTVVPGINSIGSEASDLWKHGPDKVILSRVGCGLAELGVFHVCEQFSGLKQLIHYLELVVLSTSVLETNIFGELLSGKFYLVSELSEGTPGVV